MKKLILFLIGIAAMVSGCTSEDGIDTNPEFIPIPALESLDMSGQEQQMNAAINDFAFDLLNTVAIDESLKNESEKKDNVVLSPLSVSLAMSMLANTLDGSETGVCRAYGVSDVDAVNRFSNRLMRYLSSDSEGSTLKFANSVWVDEGNVLNPEYTALMRDVFYAEQYQTDLRSPESVDLINSWVSAKTDNLIEKFLKDPCKATIVLMNALCYQGKWAKEFNPKDTQKATFHGSAGDNTVDMMNNCVGALYSLSDNNYDYVEIGFKGKTSLTIMMPKNMTVAEAAKNIKLSDLNQIEKGRGGVALSLPKLSLSGDYLLTEILETLGVNLSGTLNKTGILKKTGFNALHSTAIELDETGAKLAAVTAFIGWTSPGGAVARVCVDRPFLFFIRNTETGSVLLCGYVNNL